MSQSQLTGKVKIVLFNLLKALIFIFNSPESPRETNSKDSPASQADSGVFSIASSASPSKGDGGGLNSDVRSPDSPSRLPCLDSAASQCKSARCYIYILRSQQHFLCRVEELRVRSPLWAPPWPSPWPPPHGRDAVARLHGRVS